MPVKFYASRNLFMNGAWLVQGDEVDVSGFRTGAVNEMLSKGDIFADSSASGAYAPGAKTIAAGDLGRVIAYDTFDRPGGALIGSTADSGQTWAGTNWAPQIEDGRVRFGGVRGDVYATVPTGVADLSLDVSVKAIGDVWPGLVFREEGGDRLWAQIRLGSVRLLIESGGTTDVLATFDPSLVDGVFFRLSVTAKGEQVQVFIDNHRVIAHTLSEAQMVDVGANTNHGIAYRSGSTPEAAYWDDFVIRE